MRSKPDYQTHCLYVNKVHLTGNRPARLDAGFWTTFSNWKNSWSRGGWQEWEDKEIIFKSKKKILWLLFPYSLVIGMLYLKISKEQMFALVLFPMKSVSEVGLHRPLGCTCEGWLSCTEACQHTLQQSPINHLTVLQVESLHHVLYLYSQPLLLPLNSSLLLPSWHLTLSAPVPDLVPICLQLHQFNSLNQQNKAY